MHANVTSVVCKNGNHAAQSKFLNSTFLPRFDVVGRSSNAWKKEPVPSSMALVPRATLTFDPPATNADKKKQTKHTVDPASPDFLPLPSFEQCFPKSTKESRFTLSSLIYILFDVSLVRSQIVRFSMPFCRKLAMRLR